MPRVATLKTALLAGASIAVTLLALEAGMRIYVLHSSSPRRLLKYTRTWDPVPLRCYRYVAHPYLGYVPNPEFRSEEGRDRHNALGFRGEDVDAVKGDGVYRIFCLGGSTTYTTGVDDYRDSYPARLERVLREEYGHTAVQVINAGAAGYSSWESLLNLQLRVLPLQPDLVVVCDGINDVPPRLVPHEDYRRDNSGYQKWFALREFASHQPQVMPHRWWDHSMLAHYVSVKLGASAPRGVGARPRTDSLLSSATLASNPPVFFESNLEQMAVLAQHCRVGIMFATAAHSRAYDDYVVGPVYELGIAQNNDAIRRVGRRLNVPVFDFDLVMPGDKAYWADNAHVNAQGAARQAALFGRYIREHFRIPPGNKSVSAGSDKRG